MGFPAPKPRRTGGYRDSLPYSGGGGERIWPGVLLGLLVIGAAMTALTHYVLIPNSRKLEQHNESCAKACWPNAVADYRRCYCDLLKRAPE